MKQGWMVIVTWESGDTFGRDDGNVWPLEPANSFEPIAWTDKAQAEEAARRVKEHAKWASSYGSWREPDPPLPRPEYCPAEYMISGMKWLDLNNVSFFYVPVEDAEIVVCSNWTGYFDSFWDARVISEQDFTKGIEI